MKIDICAGGDYYARIPDYHEIIRISWPNMDGDAEERERVRAIFRDAFNDLTGGSVTVTFGDGCFVCREADGHRKGCPDSPEAIEEQRTLEDAD